MKKLRVVSLVFLTIGGIFSALLFGLLIILKSKFNPTSPLYNPAHMLHEDVASLVLQFGGQSAYDNALAKPTIVGGALIGISSFLVLMYLIPNYLSKNGGYKGFGAIFALLLGILTLFFTLMASLFGMEASNTGAAGLEIFKLNLEITVGYILLFVGPFFTFIGGILATTYYNKIRKVKPLTEDQKNRLAAINLETGKIGAKGLTPQKESVTQQDIDKRKDDIINNQSTPTVASENDDLKIKMAALKAKMAQNALLNEGGEARVLPSEENGYNNSRWTDKKVEPTPPPTIRVGEEGQYLRTIKEGVGVVDESPRGVAIEKEGNFVKKGDIIKHHDYAAPKIEPSVTSREQTLLNARSIIIPKSKQNANLDTRSLEERIGTVAKPTGKQRVNPNAKVDHSYDGKVFLGDIDKIWTAGQKYREDITKQPSEKGTQNYDQANNSENHLDNDVDQQDSHH